MKKANIINLIRYYVDNNDSGFRAEAHEIARQFDEMGDTQLASYIMSMLSARSVWEPQGMEVACEFLRQAHSDDEALFLPESITKDILGIVNAVNHKIEINKFLFEGSPGTGKTVAAKKLSKLLKRSLYIVDTSLLIDSKLGQTQKNIQTLFDTINSYAYPEKLIVLFDEIDSIALDRTNQNDLREMGRATSTMLKGMDNLNKSIILLATTNLFKYFDKALTRRFDFVINFDRYSENDLLEISEKILHNYLDKTKLLRNVNLFRKILKLVDSIPYPGDLHNLIRTAIVFSDPGDGADYFRRLYSAINKGLAPELGILKEQGFTVREIGLLTQQSKSGVSRKLQEVK